MLKLYERQLVQTLPENVIGQDYIVGDLHSCYSELKALLDYVNFNYYTDRLFCTGDLMHRGSEPNKCLSLLKESWFYSVIGNHDMANMKHKGTPIEQILFEEYQQELSQLPYIIHVHGNHNSFFIVHAEITYPMLYGEKEPNGGMISKDQFMLSGAFGYHINKILVSWSKGEYPKIDKYADLVWSRKIFDAFKKIVGRGGFSSIDKTGLKIFCGHNVVPFVQAIGHQIYIDTGAGYAYSVDGKSEDILTINPYGFFYLSMVNVNSGTIYGARAKTLEVFEFDNNLYK